MARCPLKLCVKLVWLGILLVSPLITHGIPYYLALALTSIASLILLAFSGHGRIGLLLAAGFSVMAGIILLVDYMAGTEYGAASERLAYTISSALLLAYIALTTSASEAEMLLGRNILTQPLVFINVLSAEVSLINEAMRSRGHEVRGPRSAIPLLVAFLTCVLDRMDVLEESLKARGVE